MANHKASCRGYITVFPLLPWQRIENTHAHSHKQRPEAIKTEEITAVCGILFPSTLASLQLELQCGSRSKWNVPQRVSSLLLTILFSHDGSLNVVTRKEKWGKMSWHVVFNTSSIQCQCFDYNKSGNLSLRFLNKVLKGYFCIFKPGPHFYTLGCANNTKGLELVP